MRIDFVMLSFVGGGKVSYWCVISTSQGIASVSLFSLGSPQNEQGQLVDRLTSNSIPVESAGCDSPWQIVSAYRFLRKNFETTGQTLFKPFSTTQILLASMRRVLLGEARVAGIPCCTKPSIPQHS